MGCAMFGCLFALYVAYVCVDGIGLIGTANASQRWQQSSGVITASEVVGECYVRNARCTLNIAYSYQVNGVQHQGDRLYIGYDRLHPVARAQAYGEKYKTAYPIGLKTVIHYNPNDPGQSVLEPGVSKRSFARLVAGVVLAVQGGLLVFAFFALKRLGKYYGLGMGLVIVVLSLFGTWVWGAFL
jgi:hypothetical protein